MALFAKTRRETRSATQHLVGGFVSLQAFWALYNAGVLHAMLQSPIVPATYAAEKNMSATVLEALLCYLASQDLLQQIDGTYTLASAGEEAMQQAAALEFVRGHQGVLLMVEHLLGQLKTYGQTLRRREDIVARAQAARWLPEVYPAIAHAVKKTKAHRLLDASAGDGSLLVRLLEKDARYSAVGLCANSILAIGAELAAKEAKLLQRLLFAECPWEDFRNDPAAALRRARVPANAYENTQCILLCDALADAPGGGETVLRQLGAAFPEATLVVAQPCAEAFFQSQANPAETELLLRLSNRTPVTEAACEALFAQAQWRVASHTRLQTDGVSVFALRRG